MRWVALILRACFVVQPGHAQLRQLVDEMPDLATGPITHETKRWLGREILLIEIVGNLTDIVQLKVAAQNLTNVATRNLNAQAISTSSMPRWRRPK